LRVAAPQGWTGCGTTGLEWHLICDSARACFPSLLHMYWCNVALARLNVARLCTVDDPHGCERCARTPNMCKGTIVSELMARHPSCRVVYVVLTSYFRAHCKQQCIIVMFARWDGFLHTFVCFYTCHATDFAAEGRHVCCVGARCGFPIMTVVVKSGSRFGVSHRPLAHACDGAAVVSQFDTDLSPPHACAATGSLAACDAAGSLAACSVHRNAEFPVAPPAGCAG
jgi:hypothetical protein